MLHTIQLPKYASTYSRIWMVGLSIMLLRTIHIHEGITALSVEGVAPLLISAPFHCKLLSNKEEWNLGIIIQKPFPLSKAKICFKTSKYIQTHSIITFLPWKVGTVPIEPFPQSKSTILLTITNYYDSIELLSLQSGKRYTANISTFHLKSREALH